MLFLLRKVRKQLMKENKVTSYLLYAIGEIVLVVIGILIAVSINNWNESKKTSAQINDNLRALKTDLVQDTLLIVERLPFVLEQHALNEAARVKVAAPEATIDTLIRIMRYEYDPSWRAQILYNTNAYNSLNQTRLIEKLEDSLKSNIKSSTT